MAQTQLGSLNVFVFNLFHDFDKMGSDAPLELGDGFIVGAGDFGFVEDSKSKS